MAQLKTWLKEKCKWHYLGYPCLLLVSLAVAMISTDQSTPIHAFFILMYYFIILFVVIGTGYTIFEILQEPSEENTRTSVIKSLIKKLGKSIAWIAFTSITICLSLLIWKNLSSDVNVTGIYEMLNYLHASTTSLLLLAYLFFAIVQALFIAVLCIGISRRINNKGLRQSFLIWYLLIVFLILIVQISFLPGMAEMQPQNSLTAIVDLVNDYLFSMLPYFALYVVCGCLMMFIVSVLLETRSNHKTYYKYKNDPLN